MIKKTLKNTKMNSFGTLKAEKTVAEQVAELQAKGSKLTVEELTAFVEAKEAKKAKANKTSNKRWEARESVANVTITGNCFHNIEAMNLKASKELMKHI